MHLHHWQDLQKLLDKIVEEYEVKSAALEPTQAFPLDETKKKNGELVTIAYKWKEYKKCRCFYLSPSSDCSDLSSSDEEASVQDLLLARIDDKYRKTDEEVIVQVVSPDQGADAALSDAGRRTRVVRTGKRARLQRSPDAPAAEAASPEKPMSEMAKLCATLTEGRAKAKKQKREARVRVPRCSASRQEKYSVFDSTSPDDSVVYCPPVQSNDQPIAVSFEEPKEKFSRNFPIFDLQASKQDRVKSSQCLAVQSNISPPPPNAASSAHNVPSSPDNATSLSPNVASSPHNAASSPPHDSTPPPFVSNSRWKFMRVNSAHHGATQDVISPSNFSINSSENCDSKLKMKSFGSLNNSSHNGTSSSSGSETRTSLRKKITGYKDELSSSPHSSYDPFSPSIYQDPLIEDSRSPERNVPESDLQDEFYSSCGTDEFEPLSIVSLSAVHTPGNYTFLNNNIDSDGNVMSACSPDMFSDYLHTADGSIDHKSLSLQDARLCNEENSTEYSHNPDADVSENVQDLEILDQIDPDSCHEDINDSQLSASENMMTPTFTSSRTGNNDTSAMDAIKPANLPPYFSDVKKFGKRVEDYEVSEGNPWVRRTRSLRSVVPAPVANLVDPPAKDRWFRSQPAAKNCTDSSITRQYGSFGAISPSKSSPNCQVENTGCESSEKTSEVPDTRFAYLEERSFYVDENGIPDTGSITFIHSKEIPADKHDVMHSSPNISGEDPPRLPRAHKLFPRERSSDNEIPDNISASMMPSRQDSTSPVIMTCQLGRQSSRTNNSILSINDNPLNSFSSTKCSLKTNGMHQSSRKTLSTSPLGREDSLQSCLQITPAAATSPDACPLARPPTRLEDHLEEYSPIVHNSCTLDQTLPATSKAMPKNYPLSAICSPEEIKQIVYETPYVSLETCPDLPNGASDATSSSSSTSATSKPRPSTKTQKLPNAIYVTKKPPVKKRKIKYQSTEESLQTSDEGKTEFDLALMESMTPPLRNGVTEAKPCVLQEKKETKKNTKARKACTENSSKKTSSMKKSCAKASSAVHKFKKRNSQGEVLSPRKLARAKIQRSKQITSKCLMETFNSDDELPDLDSTTDPEKLTVFHGIIDKPSNTTQVGIRKRGRPKKTGISSSSTSCASSIAGNSKALKKSPVKVNSKSSNPTKLLDDNVPVTAFDEAISNEIGKSSSHSQPIRNNCKDSPDDDATVRRSPSHRTGNVVFSDGLTLEARNDPKVVDSKIQNSSTTSGRSKRNPSVPPRFYLDHVTDENSCEKSNKNLSSKGKKLAATASYSKSRSKRSSNQKSGRNVRPGTSKASGGEQSSLKDWLKGKSPSDHSSLESRGKSKPVTTQSLANDVSECASQEAPPDRLVASESGAEPENRNNDDSWFNTGSPEKDLHPNSTISLENSNLDDEEDPMDVLLGCFEAEAPVPPHCEPENLRTVMHKIWSDFKGNKLIEWLPSQLSWLRNVLCGKELNLWHSTYLRGVNATEMLNTYLYFALLSHAQITTIATFLEENMEPEINARFKRDPRPPHMYTWRVQVPLLVIRKCCEVTGLPFHESAELLVAARYSLSKELPQSSSSKLLS
ncbi:uncharacterized protein LOC108674842 [Hyalella azteca]|uniref:Uncharacterized protein LOC108674842 n=1 Tax=Hyalella azteca TaxID=294128 RepID=A0A8B7NX60_HYAAZ|nr:uncharacterized protein LOC108674842 [Hyalella azteca]